MRNHERSARIAVVTHERDLHAHAVKAEMERRYPATVHIFETDHFSRAPGLSWSPQGFTESVFPANDGTAVDVQGIDAIWFRRLGNTRTTANPEVTDPGDRELIYADTRAAVLGMLTTEFRGRWIDHPEAFWAAQNKVVQLRAAHDLGLRIPETLISQSPDQIRKFCGIHPSAIVKAVRGVVQAPAATATVSEKLLANESAMRLCPAIYQELVPGRRHVRVQVFGERVLAALLESDDLDWRPNLDIPATEHHLPSDIQNALRAVLRRLNLTMGIFDLKLTDDDEYVWLEVNPQGQWLFVEGMAGLPLIETFTDFLYGQATR
ncbi:RimK family alpha-L-glutamate ligase [Nonomuraea sp. MTCD27]|uniref:ATP-grasp domain-containing protein n=1 Tax=Nonomuraea sp. MTCD27 TaxID=1676747 RepID=UPI0035C1ABF2